MNQLFLSLLFLFAGAPRQVGPVSFTPTLALSGELRPGHAAQEDDCSSLLFSCETERRGKFVRICAVEEEAGKRWRDLQYRFGPVEKPEMTFPTDPSKLATPPLFFFHEERKAGYYVSIRFSAGGYGYRVFSESDGRGAGVIVSDARGNALSTINCIERPYMFPSYLRRALPCDLKNPHGKAACGENPYRAKP
jgi:hypothetical protein